ncbi:MAG: hypothetical protein IKU36_02240 [Bacteroidales bacterium]|nr:hypothetical protein [Bacteroidales bacterium]
MLRNIVFYVAAPKVKEIGYYYLICDPEEVVGVAINWLREKYDIFYTPGMEVPAEDFDVDEAAKEYEKATRNDVVPVAKVREALGIGEDTDIFEWIAFLKKSNERAHSEMYKARGGKYELLKQVREILNINPEANLFDALRGARGDMDAVTRLRLESSELRHQNYNLGRRIADIRKTAGMKDDDPTDLVKYVEALREDSEELADHRVAEGWLRKDNSDLSIDVANLKEQLRVLRYEILKVYREIFDCSNGDPEGTDEETMNDILTEYNRTLELKNVAEEKTIKYKELARENEEKAAKYADIAKENRLRYEKIKSELDEMTKIHGESVITSGGLCEDLAMEREKVKRMEQKLIEIQDICER